MKHSTIHMIIAALCLALCLVMPFLTGQIPEIGTMLLPMHYGVFLCAYLADRKWAAAVGFTAPIMRSLLFGMPPIYPQGLAMAFELATYGLVAGFLNTKLPRASKYIYVSLISSMIIGRIVWGIVSVVLYGISGNAFTWSAFIAGSFLKAIPGIIMQIIIIPVIIMALRKAKLIDQHPHGEHAHG